MAFESKLLSFLLNKAINITNHLVNLNPTKTNFDTTFHEKLF